MQLLATEDLGEAFTGHGWVELIVFLDHFENY